VVKNLFLHALLSLLIMPSLSLAYGGGQCDHHIGLTSENVDFKDNRGNTPLFKSISKYRFSHHPSHKNKSPEGCLKSIETLLKLGANPNLKIGDGKDWSAFNNTYRRGEIFEPVIDLMLEYGADINSYDGRIGFGFWVALDKFNVTQLEKYLSKGADPNLPIRKNGKHYPIDNLVSENEIEKVSVFIKHGVNPNHKTYRNWPLIVWAAMLNHSTIVLMLADAGANLNSVNEEGRSVLHYAGRKNKELYKRLIELGADDSLRAKNGKTPWEYFELPEK
jgi:ankyrin repeat protein